MAREQRLLRRRKRRKEIKKVKKEKMKAVCTLIKQYITAYGEREIKVARV